MILKGDKAVQVREELAVENCRQTLAEAHAAAKYVFGAHYRAAVEPVCAKIRSLMACTGFNAVKAGTLIVLQIERQGNIGPATKAITMAAIYEVDQEICPTRN